MESGRFSLATSWGLCWATGATRPSETGTLQFLVSGVHEQGSCDIGQFDEAGLHELVPFVIFHARSWERSQRHFWMISE